VVVGKSVTDLANEVLDRIYKEKNGTPDEEEEEDGVDNEQEEGDGDNGGEVVEYGVEQPVEPLLRPSAFRPVHWWVFLLYGPWGAETFGYAVHQLLAIGHDMKPTTSANSERALRGLKEEKERLERDTELRRGHSDATHFTLIQNDIQNQMTALEGRIVIIKTKIQGARDSFQEGLALKMDERVLMDYHETRIRHIAELEELEKRYDAIINSKTSYSMVVDLTDLDDEEVAAPVRNSNGTKRRRISSRGGTQEASSSAIEI
jgi:hypothetical protein